MAAYPGIPELLETLVGRGVRLGLATSKSMEVAEPVLESLGLRGHFAVAEGTRVDELGTHKANGSALLRRFVSKADEMIARMRKDAARPRA